MATYIDIASNALILIGDNPISSFNDPGAGAQAAGNLYRDTYRQLLAMHPWTFALKEQRLSRLSQGPDPETGFQFAFQIPSDHIRTWAVLPVSNYSAVGDLLYSNHNDLLMRYVFQVEETELPSHFTKTLEYVLAREFAQLVTESTSKSAYFEELYRKSLASALSVDGQGQTATPIIDSPFVDVRNRGNFR